VPNQLADAIALLGPKERIRDRIQAWKAHQVPTLLIGSGQPEAVEAVAEAVQAGETGYRDPKQPIASPSCIAGSQRCFCSSEPQRQIANIASDPWTETRLRTPASPASSSMQVSP
jgi:hypothetical protein